MGGYASKLKGKIKSKWKAKFGSGSKTVSQSSPVIGTNSMRGNPLTNDKHLNDTMENSKKNLTQEAKTGNVWKSAKHTTNQDIENEISADVNATVEDRLGIKQEEIERFKAAHPSDDMKEKLDAVLNELCKDQKKKGPNYKGVESYKKYTSEFYYKIMNSLARTGKPPEMATDNQGNVWPVEREDVEIAIAAMKDMSNDMENSRLTQNLVVYRGAGKQYTNVIRDQLGVGTELTGDELNRKLKGAVLFDKAFTSTSLNPDVATDFATRNSENEEATILQIYAHKGLKATYLDLISAFGGEDELLVDQNTPLRILDVNMVVDPQTGIKYRLVKAEFLSFFAGEHRTRMSNDYDLPEAKGKHLKKQGPVPQAKKGLSSGQGSGPGTLIKVAERKVK